MSLAVSVPRGSGAPRPLCLAVPVCCGSGAPRPLCLAVPVCCGPGMSRCGPPELRERRNFGVLRRRLSGFCAVGSPIPQLFVPAGEPLCRALRRRGGDCRYFVDRICPGILKVGWNALPLHCCPRRFLRYRRTIPAGGRRQNVCWAIRRTSEERSGGHRKGIRRASGENEYDLQYRPAGA